MPKRFKLKKSYSKKVFRQGTKTHERNVINGPMRGGIRF